MDWMIEYGFINKNQKNLPMGSSDLFCFDANYIKQRSVGSQKIEFASLISKDKISILIDDSPDVLKLASYTPNILPATILHPWNKSTVDEFQIPSAKNWMKLSGELSKVYGLPLYVNHGKAIYNYS